MAEVQAAVFARVWSGRLQLPPDEVMQGWEEQLVASLGATGRGYHLLKFPKDAEHMNMLHEWAMSAEEGPSGKGKIPPCWKPREYWIRERFALIKKAFQDQGEARHKITTVEELGFDYDESVRKQPVRPVS